MKLALYQVDAFAHKLFTGNPAAVVPLENWLEEDLMQKIAMENNLAETVFFIPEKDGFGIRWFTPEAEINLCGHATLAAAHVLYQYLGYEKADIIFYSKSGPLYVNRVDDLIQLDFPSWMPEKIDIYPDNLSASLGGVEIVAVYKKRDMVVELVNEAAVRNCQPDFTMIKKMNEKIIITAKGDKVDFVSRFFAPSIGVDEDPVTGSAHSQLIPLWSYKFDKTIMKARQLSKRGGELYCEQKGERVIMGGKCVFYMKGEIEISDQNL